MRLRYGWALLAVLLGVATAEAGWLGGDRLPKPASPILDGKLREGQKPLPKAQHPARYARPGWGAPWKQIFRRTEIRTPHYNRVR
jgi:hypothetical protein